MAARSSARSGYQATREGVAGSPLSSLAIAALVGLGIGWVLRGQHEDDRRRALMDSLPSYLRRRIG